METHLTEEEIKRLKKLSEKTNDKTLCESIKDKLKVLKNNEIINK